MLASRLLGSVWSASARASRVAVARGPAAWRAASGPHLRALSAGGADPGPPGLVLGCGSNVVDLFYRVKTLPGAGDKGYFSGESPLVDTVVGGVTLNHLCWARALGAPTGLMALQGTDDNGKFIRDGMKEHDVSTATVRVSEEYGTSVSHVIVDE